MRRNFCGTHCFLRCSALILTLEHESAIGYLLLPWGSRVEFPVVHLGSCHPFPQFARRLPHWLKLAWMMRNLDSYIKMRAGRRQRETTSNLTGNTLPSLNPLGAFMLALKLLDCIFLINEWAVAFRGLLFSGIIQYICLWLKLQLHSTSEKYCILLPIGTLYEFFIYSLCIYIYLYI